MGQVLHGCATTTEAIRRAIQNSQESLRALARRYGINQKTVVKWKKRETVADLPAGPKDAKSTVLSIGDEAIRVCQIFCVRGFRDRLDCFGVIVPPLEIGRQTGSQIAPLRPSIQSLGANGGQHF